MAIVLEVRGRIPSIGTDVFLSPNAAITGDVTMKNHSSAFYGVSVRGDVAPIEVGCYSNLQDNVVLHADEGFPCVVGAGVSVGHAAVVHGATIGDHCLIGMSATVLNGATIGKESLIAAGAVVPQGASIPPRSLVAGVPGKVRRQLTETEVQHLHANANIYLELKDSHLQANSVPQKEQETP